MDPYSTNPLAEAAAEAEPQRYAEVAAVKDPPKLFAGGTSDLPAFTASGIEPALLLRLPYGVRHAAAANPDVVQVHSWFEDYAQFPEAVIDHDGLRAAQHRVENWLRNTDLDTRTPEQRKSDEDAEYEAYERLLSPTGQTRAEVEQQRRERREREAELMAELRTLQAGR